jgi:hypothetical protein
VGVAFGVTKPLAKGATKDGDLLRDDAVTEIEVEGRHAY